MRKAKNLKESKSKENTDDGGDKKRKREDGDMDEINKKLKESSDGDAKKKPLSVTTNSKLASFAFKNDES